MPDFRQVWLIGGIVFFFVVLALVLREAKRADGHIDFMAASIAVVTAIGGAIGWMFFVPVLCAAFVITKLLGAKPDA
jgi:hypothetical protein